jgi:hypothetical protein
VFRVRRARVSTMETGPTYSIIRTWRGENHLLIRVQPEKGLGYRKVLRVRLLGSQIDNSHACFLPPSSAN